MSELVQSNGFSLAEISKKLGAAGNKSPSIPTLKINSFGEDADGNQIPLGAFFLNTPEDRVYAKEGVKLRAFSNNIQFQHWENGKLINKSLLVEKASDEARDQLGGINCGLPSFEVQQAMSPQEREKFNGIDRYRIIRGIVSYTGKTAQGKEVTIEDQPCVLSLKRKNYGPFYHDVINKMRRDTNLWDFESILRAEKRKSPKGASYYVMHFSPQLKNLITWDEKAEESIQYVFGLLQAENARIEESYKNALKANQEEEEYAEAYDAVEDLSEDYVAAAV
tara:strand:+ start:867 stop:1703 length:837 start_codon:yes stop_codon:yes gene_type:complete